jgi:hypothetical protein
MGGEAEMDEWNWEWRRTEGALIPIVLSNTKELHF